MLWVRVHVCVCVRTWGLTCALCMPVWDLMRCLRCQELCVRPHALFALSGALCETSCVVCVVRSSVWDLMRCLRCQELCVRPHALFALSGALCETSCVVCVVRSSVWDLMRCLRCQELCEKQEVQMRQLQKTLLDTTAESRQTQGQLEEQLKQLESIRSSIKSKSWCAWAGLSVGSERLRVPRIYSWHGGCVRPFLHS